MPPLILKTKRKPKLVLDECNLAPQITKQYLGILNATDIVPHGTSDMELLAVAEERKLKVVTIDVRFVLAAVSLEKEIVYQNSENKWIHLKPKIIENNCKNKIHCCKMTSYIRYSHEVILP